MATWPLKVLIGEIQKMAVVSKKISIVIALITLTIIVGCGNILDIERPPLAIEKHGVNRWKLPWAKATWSRDFGPEQSGHFRSVTLGDFNNDGKVDMAGGSYEPGTIFLWHGDGAGNWTRAQRFRIRGDIRSLAAGDINNDGWLDIVSSTMGDSNGVQAWINKEGIFGDMLPVSEKDFFDGLRLADVNSDGKLDIIAANKTGVVKGGINVWLGTGKGNFIMETGPTRTNMYSDVEVGDFNNDGKIDIVGAAWGHDGGALRVWLGSGDGRWSEVKSEVDKGSFWGVDVADINGDGNPDIISAANFDGVKIHYGDGKGNFSKKDTLAKQGNFWRAKAVDLNNDGLLDIAATLSDNNGVIVWYQESWFKWLIAKDEGLPKNGSYFDIEFADFNDDNKLDIAATTYGEGIKIWLRDTDNLTESETKEEEVVVDGVKKEEEEMMKKPPVPVFFTSVFFDTETADLSAEAITILNNLLDVLKSVEGTVLRLKKHADFKGVDSKQSPGNHALSEDRIKTVTDFFISRGISQERIEIDTRVDSKVDNESGDKKAWQENSRVDITVNYGKSLDSKQVDKTEIDANADSESDEEGIYAYPFIEKGDLIPVKEYKTWKMVNGIPEYRIGSGDILNIRFWIGLNEKTYQVTVSPQNTISFSYIKNFEVTGYTTTELEKEFTRQLSGIFRDPFIKIEVPDINKNAHSLSIFGAVRSLGRQPTGPGTYRMLGKERISQFLSRAGGHEPTADLTRVQLTRDRKVYFINLFDALFKSDYRQDVVIEKDDVFFIPSKTEIKNRVFVMGEVNRPGLFSFDKSISLFEAVIGAGGPTVYAKARQVLVIRGSVEKPEAIKVNLMDIVQRGDFRKDIPLNNGDVVYVARNILGDIRNFVRAFGPFVQLANLPTSVYEGTTFPRIKGVPFEREVAPSISTIQQGVPTLPQGAGTWSGQQAQ
jgi:protein involved in polysaccharide export with SLBB domain/outer membrane protein OmpA-like peptidoglycan-associated protein